MYQISEDYGSKRNEYGPLDQQELLKLEEAYGGFPEDYKRFLSTDNGGSMKTDMFKSSNGQEYYVSYLFGVHRGSKYCNVSDVTQAFDEWIPSHFIGIGHNHGGNYYLLSFAKEDYGSVHCFEHDNLYEGSKIGDNILKIADSFSEFLDGLYEEQNDSDVTGRIEGDSFIIE